LIVYSRPRSSDLEPAARSHTGRRQKKTCAKVATKVDRSFPHGECRILSESLFSNRISLARNKGGGTDPTRCLAPPFTPGSPRLNIGSPFAGASRALSGRPHPEPEWGRAWCRYVNSWHRQTVHLLAELTSEGLIQVLTMTNC
jgi:hypothetical protein